MLFEKCRLRCKKCMKCASVCPTDAIQHLLVKEKIERPIRIGSAYIDRGRCLPWSENGPCIVCEEHCPTSPKAIHLKGESYLSRDGKTIRVKLPYVEEIERVWGTEKHYGLVFKNGCSNCESRCTFNPYNKQYEELFINSKDPFCRNFV